MFKSIINSVIATVISYAIVDGIRVVVAKAKYNKAYVNTIKFHKVRSR